MEESNKEEESGDELNNFDSHATTSRSISHYRFKWTLKDFSRLPLPIESPVFKLLSVGEISIRLSISPNLYLYFDNIMKKECSSNKIEWGSSGYDCNGKLLFQITSNQHFSNQIRSGLKKNHSLLADTIIVVFHYSVFGPVASEIHNFRQPPVLQYTAQEKLVLDLKAMCEKHQHTDVTLRVEDCDFLGHKSILSARSSVFEKIFQSEMKEREQNIVLVEDIKIPALKKFLDFLYIGTVEAEEDIEATYELYYVADKYEVMDLRQMCADTMRAKVTVENAIQIAIWADRHDDEFLKMSILDFISIHFNSITDTDDWEQFVVSEGKLAAQMMKHCIKKPMN